MRKKESKFTIIDLIIVFFCFAGACFSGAAFWGEYNTTLVKLNEDPVGTIIFKKRVAQRKFIDRNVWDRLKQASFVYNGDTIRTIEQSEAVVIFQDEVTHLSMDESTMIQVLYDKRGGARIDFSGGNLDVVSENKNIVITSGTSTITVEGQARMEKGEEGFVLSVSEGQASFDGIEMEAGGILALDSDGEINTSPIISMTSFGASACFLAAAGEAYPVVFSWNSLNFNPDTHVIVEAASDRSFDSIVETRDIYGASSVSVPLDHGSYWWRAYPTEGGGRNPINSFYPSGTLELIPSAAALLLSPPQTAELVFPVETLIPLSWSVVEGAAAYLVEISARADMSAPVVSRRVEENSVTQIGLDFGRWYWRITPVFPPRVKGAALPSAVGEFSAIRGSPVLSAPVLTFPADNGKMYLDAPGAQTAGSSGRLMWNHDQNAASWLVELADNPAMANPKVKQNAASNYFSLSSELLAAGKTWYWRVSALGAPSGGSSPVPSDVWKFEVGAGNPSAARPVLPVIPQFPSITFGANIENWNDLDAETAAANDRILLRIVQFLDANAKYRLRVEGHANSTVNPGDIDGRRREQDRELLPMSKMRAAAIADELVKLGADPGRLEIHGFGGGKPIAAWGDVSNWWKNRRVEFAVLE